MYKMGIIIHSACLMGIFIQMQGRTIWEPVIMKQSSRCQNIFVCLDHSLLLPHTSAQCGHPFFLVDASKTGTGLVAPKRRRAVVD